MKLAAKLIVALALGVFVVMAINTYFRLKSEVSLFTAPATGVRRRPTLVKQ
jgi:hypothetical protein